MHSTSAKTSGYSLIELVLASSLLSLMIMALITLATNGSDSQEYARRVSRVTEITHELLDQLRVEMVSSVRLFGNDTEGTENLDLLDLAGAPVPIPTTRLPTVSPSESIRPDTVGNEITGNSLFFARLAWTDRFVCPSGNEYFVDVYRWNYYYLTPEDGGPSPGNPIGLNIVRIESEPLIDAASIDRITDVTDRADVLLHLHDGTPDALGVRHAPCEVVWVRGQLPSVSGTLRMIDSGTGALSNSPLGARPNPWTVLRAEQPVRGLLTYRHHSIATNYSPANYGVGRYSVATNSGAGYPHGFEIEIVGPPSARQTLVHAVISSTNRRGHWAWSEVQVVIDTRDL
jgi:type II secretory pathway pseudopilin PulG